MRDVVIEFRGYGWLAAFAIAGAGLMGCGDGKNTGEVDPPEIRVSPVTVAFSLVEVGSTDLRTLSIGNEGGSTLVIDRLRITQDPDGLFSVLNAPSTPIKIEPEESITIDLEFAPQSSQGVESILEIRSNSLENNGLTRVPLETITLEPVLFVAPSPVLFDRVAVGGSADVTVNVQNIGTAALVFDSVALVGPEFSLDPNPPGLEGVALEPDQDLTSVGKTLAVRYSPTQVGAVEGELQLYWHPREDQSGEQRLLRIPVRSVGTQPCIRVSPSEIDFGNTLIGRQPGAKVLNIENCADPVAGQALDVSSASFVDEDGVTSSPEFRLECEGELPWQIAPGQTKSCTVTYQPTDEGADVGLIRLDSNDSVQPVTKVNVRGIGSNNQCPTAVASCTIQGRGGPASDQLSAIPLDTIRCDASASFDPAGDSITSFLWEVTVPSGSQTRPSPANNVPAPTFFLDSAGVYTISLTVYDELGTASCEPAIVTVTAIPDEALHGEIFWRTPADANETDTTGSDVDLHMVHQNGTWFDSRWDCFFANCPPTGTLNWGTAAADDNPSLDLDDVDGAGPENINLDKPEDGKRYVVGIHYWDSHGFGDAFVTGRLYVNGILVHELRDQLMKDNNFCDLVAVQWPSGSLSPFNRCYTNVCGSPFKPPATNPYYSRVCR